MSKSEEWLDNMLNRGEDAKPLIRTGKGNWLWWSSIQMVNSFSETFPQYGWSEAHVIKRAMKRIEKLEKKGKKR